jgi:hypothetical protein
MGGRDKLVGVRLDPHCHPDQHFGAHPRGLRQEPETGDLGERVHHHPSNPGVQCRRKLRRRLVVAVHQDPLGREAGAQGDLKLATGGHIQTQTLLGDPGCDRHREESLGRVVDVAAGECRPERATARPEVRLVQEERGRAELGGEVSNVMTGQEHHT